MSRNDPCDASRLIAVLEDGSNGVAADETIQHLAGCTECQSRLEQLAADRWWWSEGRDLLRSSAEIDLDSLPFGSRAAALDEAATFSPISSQPWTLDFLGPPSHPELLGRLGKYEIERVIGWGGMGIVFKGFDTELNRVVAIKVLAPHLATSGAARQRFAREARAAAAVVHEHVVAIYGIETAADPPYLVMPYVAGESLERHVYRHGPLAATDIVRIAMQIASGLSAAHEQGLVHRDVKPANILLDNGFGRVLITDFGLARAADDASLTRTGLLAGTPHYMSPEQANGKSVDHRSDLFSLGGVMYFMASGRPPFRAEGAMAVLNLICHKHPAPLLEVNPDIPRPLARIIERLHSKQPSHRFESATALRGLLAEYVAHLQNPTRHKLPAALGEKSRRRGTWTALAVAGLVLFALLLAWPGQHRRAAWEADRARPVVGDPASGSASNRTAASANAKSGPKPTSPSELDNAIQALVSDIANFEEQMRLDESPASLTLGEREWDKQMDGLQHAMEVLEQALNAADGNPKRQRGGAGVAPKGP